MKRITHNFTGWRPDAPDFRDYKLAVSRPTLRDMPPKWDMRGDCPPVLDQGNLGSCTANAIAFAHRFEQRKQAQAGDFDPSRLFIYYNERKMEGTVPFDAGASIRDGIKSIAKQGVCPETEWPYVISKFAKRPPDSCFTHAKQHQALKYYGVPRSPTLDQARGCLADGYPFVFGFTVYASFESDTVTRTGIVPMPQAGEKNLGGHAVAAVGYDDAEEWFIVRNSWGEKWGDKGYCYMPYSYLLNRGLAADFWTVRLVE